MVRYPYVDAIMWNGANIKDIKKFFGVNQPKQMYIHKDNLHIELTNHSLVIPLTGFLIRNQRLKANRYSVMGEQDFERTYMRI